MERAKGGCLCGAVRFHFSGEPLWIAHCHCSSCRRSTGAALATFVGVDAAAFTYERGVPSRHESSPAVFRSFCGRCGSALTYEASCFPGEVHVHIGALDEPDRFPPRSHVHTAEKVAWLTLADSLPGNAGSGQSGAGGGDPVDDI